MNILVLSSGTRNKIITYLKKEIGDSGSVICTDCNILAPSLYLADKYYIVPRIDDPNYLEYIMDICKKESIDGLFSLIDPELSLIAANKEKFLEIGVMPFVSNFTQVEMCFDKYKFFKFCQSNNYDTIKSYDDLETFVYAMEQGEINFPVFIKPINGSCSFNIKKVSNMKELEYEYAQHTGLLIQEFMDGEEFGIDVYIDMISGKPISIFAKKKLLMRAGETDKAVSVKDKRLFELIQDFVISAKFLGQIDIDIFKKENKYFLSEVNPRFGGGYPHAYECGCNFFQFMIQNLKGIENKPNIGNYDEDIYMMKYLDISIQKKR